MRRERLRLECRHTRAFSLGEALALELVDQERHRAIEDSGGVPRGHRVTQQCLGPPELSCVSREMVS